MSARLTRFPAFARQRLLGTRLRALLAAVGIAMSTGSAIAEVITVGGVGAVTPLVKQLAAEFTKANPSIAVAVIDPPIGSTGGLRALAAGKLDVALSGRPPKSDEAGEVQAWVRTPLVVATSDGKLQSSDLGTYAALFGGKRKAWDDGQPVRLVLRGAFESETATLRSLSPEMDDAIRATLARREAPVADNDLQAVEMLVKVKGSLGSTSYGLAIAQQGRLKMLPLNGQMPSLENLANGRYPWHRAFFLVHGASPNEPTRKFLVYLQSDRGYQAARRLGYLPPTH